MNIQQPIIDQMKKTGEKASATMDSAQKGIQSNLGDFSAKGMKNASTEFLQSNGLLAKCAFIILLIILFLFIFKLGVKALGYLLGPAKNPYLVYGRLEGYDTVTIAQDPSDKAAIPIMRSNNKNSGIEFTWSVWLYLNLNATDASSVIFVKGNPPDDRHTTNIYYQTNSPGMYVSSTNGIGEIRVYLDDVNNNQNIMMIPSVPLQKWVHVAYRLQNTVLDVYVNGVVQNRLQMNYAPKLNYYDVHVCGFNGSLSNLRYYDHALNVFDINNIVMFGPNLTPSSLSSNSSASGSYSYLSSQWYTNTFK